MTNTYATPVSQQRPSVAPWARIAGILACALLAGASAEEALHLHRPFYLLGWLPAAIILGGILLLGLRPWPIWSKLTGALLAFCGATWFTLVAFLYATGRTDWITPDFLPAAGGILAGCTITALLFLAGGWVYRDAKRRGLNAAAWATVSIIIAPYLIGFIAYLIVVVLRDQQMAVCAGCGCRLPQNTAYCIRCGRQTHPSCPECQTPTLPGAAFCGRCGTALATA